MKSQSENKYLAIELRRKGFSYKEIMTKVNVKKGTLSSWMRNLELTSWQIENIYKNSLDKQNKGRMKASIFKHEEKLKRIEIVKKEAIKEFNNYINDPLFIVGLSLYWAEGTKKDSTFSFINSDPNMIKFMVEWTQKYLKVDKKLFKIRLFIHLPYKNENLEKYWADMIGIESGSFQKTIYKPTIHLVKKNLTYKGCLRFYLNGIYYLRKIVAWQELLVKYLKI